MTTIEARLAKGLKDLALQYAPTPQNSMPTERIRVYVRQLLDLPVDAVLVALDRCGKSIDRFPSVAEIRREVATMHSGPGEIAESAWPKVRQEMRRVGYMRTPQFDDPMIAAAVESVGWRNLCGMESTKAHTEFLFAYRNLKGARVDSIQRGDFLASIDRELEALRDQGDDLAIEGKVA